MKKGLKEIYTEILSTTEHRDAKKPKPITVLIYSCLPNRVKVEIFSAPENVTLWNTENKNYSTRVKKNINALNPNSFFSDILLKLI